MLPGWLTARLVVQPVTANAIDIIEQISRTMSYSYS